MPLLRRSKPLQRAGRLLSNFAPHVRLDLSFPVDLQEGRSVEFPVSYRPGVSLLFRFSFFLFFLFFEEGQRAMSDEVRLGFYF